MAEEQINIGCTKDEKERIATLAKKYNMTVTGYMKFMALHGTATINAEETPKQRKPTNVTV